MNSERLAKLSLVLGFVLAAACPLWAGSLVRENPDRGFRLERVPVAGGAQLITLFGTRPGGVFNGERRNEIPVLSVLRDNLGDPDPENDRFRQVWVYSYAKPSLWQRLTASLPFFYHSTVKNRKPVEYVPDPLLDLGNPRKGTWRGLAEAVLQVEVLDGIGMPLRLASRSYRENAGNYRNLHLWQASTALSAAEFAVGRGTAANDVEFPVLGARLMLATRPLGGLVSEKYLQVAWEKQSHQSSMNRGHNWELLRQKAEENGLRFQPLSLAGQKDNFALLWMERPSPASLDPKSFSGQFLGISNPFTANNSCEPGERMQTWYLDEQGNRVAEDAPGARPVSMTPLALYALDHPRVPLLLVDFCRPHRPGTGERMRRFATDFTVNVLGLASLSNWQFMVAKSSFMFVRRRHGAPLDRSARLRAYAQLRYSLKFDDSLDAGLRRELERNLGGMGLNPLGVGLGSEVETAHSQYAALLKWAGSSDGLPRKVQQNRGRELAAYRHSRGARMMFGLAHIGTLGLYTHGDKLKEEGLAMLDLQRRFAYQKRFLERVLASGPQPEVAWNPEAVGRSVDALSELGCRRPKTRQQAVRLLSSLMQETSDEWIRSQCADGLQRLNALTPAHLALLPGAVSPSSADSAPTGSEGYLTGSK